jgi:hypothetical protein
MVPINSKQEFSFWIGVGHTTYSCSCYRIACASAAYSVQHAVEAFGWSADFESGGSELVAAALFSCMIDKSLVAVYSKALVNFDI